MIEQQSSLPSISCSTHNRPKHAIIAICLEHGCTTKSLLCSECLNDIHKDHKHISLSHFIQNYSLCTSDSSVNDLCRSNRQRLETLKNGCLQKVQALRQAISSNLAATEEKLIAFFEQTQSTIINETVQYENCSPMHASMISSMSTESEVRPSMGLKRQVQQYIRNRHYNFELTSQLKSTGMRLEHQATLFSEQLDKLQTMLIQGIHQVQNLFEEVIFSFQPLELEQLQEPISPQKRPFNIILKWSQTLKHPTLDLTNNTIATRIAQNTEYSPVAALTDNIFAELPPRLYMWTVKIVQLASLMVVGICHEKAASKHNFVRGYWGNIAHGHYVVGSDGYTYSHSDKAVNYKRQTFRIVKGDLLKLCYDSGRRKLDILVNSQKKWEFSIVPAPKQDCYRACVYLLDVGDCVEFITK